ncbi:MAG TPA: NUDIX domain-containing protein, partial [Opitutales bacterium]|nr:NUDIX domain-containing protein [Opitutales bacterium]
MSELFDVVDDHDRVLRRETRNEVHRQRLLHRAVHVLVFNARGEVYLQRRSAKKDTYPNRWTTSCSGHVDAGEDYDTAVVRELAEELGLQNAEIGTRSSKIKTNATANASANEYTHATKLKSQAPNLQTLPPSAFILHPFLKHPPCRETGWEFIWIYTLTTD